MWKYFALLTANAATGVKHLLGYQLDEIIKLMVTDGLGI